MPLFHHTVNDLDDWAGIYDRSEPFESLVRHILALHSLPVLPLEKTTPGSHAVFRVGEVIVKVFAPDTVGWDCEADFVTEIKTMRRAEALGISVPKLIAHGRVHDKYLFRYIIMEFVHGVEFRRAKLSDEEKYAVGKQLRAMCDKMNVPCESFNSYDFIEGALADDKWSGFPQCFRDERRDWIKRHDFGETVYTHGDIHGDNAIWTEDKEVVLLDFADSVIAPVSYEYAALIPGLFDFEKPYLEGFFGEETSREEMCDILLEGLLIHRFGSVILTDRKVKPEEVTGIEKLRRIILDLLPE